MRHSTRLKEKATTPQPWTCNESDLYVIESETMGRGVITKKVIKKNKIVTSYPGVLKTLSEAKKEDLVDTNFDIHFKYR